MTEQTMGDSGFNWFTAQVVNPFDPDQAGRHQLRIYGKHDDTTNIPDSDLPWALPHQSTTSAGAGKIGTSPVGMVKGTKVIGYFQDSDKQIPVILGVIGKSGSPVDGSTTTSGVPQIDTSTGSIPAAAQSGTNDFNPYSALYPERKGIYQIDTSPGQANVTMDMPITSVSSSEGVSVPAAAEQKMKSPKIPTTASLDKNSNPDVISGIQQVDPSSQSASLPNMVPGYLAIQNILSLVSPVGIAGMLQSTISNVLTQLGASFGVNSLLNAASSIFAQGLLDVGTNPLLSVAMADVLANATDNNGIVVAPDTIPINTGQSPSGPIAIANAIVAVLPADYSQGFTYTNQWTNRQDVITNNLTISLANGFTVSTSFQSTVPEPTAPTPSPIVNSPPSNFVQVPYTPAADPFPGYIQWTDSLINHWINVDGTSVDEPNLGNIVYTLRNGAAYYSSPSDAVVQPASSDMYSALYPSVQQSNGVLDAALLATAIASAASSIPAMGISALLGGGINLSNIINSAASLLPAIGGNIINMATNHIPTSVLNVASVSNTIAAFTQNQAILSLQINAMTSALTPSALQIDSLFATALQSYLTAQQNYFIPSSGNDFTTSTQNSSTSPSGSTAILAAIAALVGPNPPPYNWFNSWSQSQGTVTNNITVTFTDGSTESTTLVTQLAAPVTDSTPLQPVVGPSGASLTAGALPASDIPYTWVNHWVRRNGVVTNDITYTYANGFVTTIETTN